MKVLYAIQGTGGGHLSRAVEMLPALERFGHVEVLVSGGAERKEFPLRVNHRLQGLGYTFGTHGGIDLRRSFKNYSFRRFFREVMELQVHRYDVIISDMEPVSAWACWWHKKPCMALSNQAALVLPGAAKPKVPSLFGEAVLRGFVPSSHKVGLDYTARGNDVFTPLVRSSIRNRTVNDLGAYVVYLPAWSVRAQVEALRQLDHVRWQVFSKAVIKREEFGHITLHPADGKLFVNYLVNCRGVLTAAGFSATSEALFLGKKLFVIPQRGQYEQKCNSLALQRLGVSTCNKLSVSPLRSWIFKSQAIKLPMPDNADIIADRIFTTMTEYNDHYLNYLVRDQFVA